jgi:hypothetical protein
VRLQPLYRATFTTLERWAVEVAGTHGTEVQDLLIAEGRTEDASRHVWGDPTIPAGAQTGHIAPRLSRRSRHTDDGATILFSWHGYARPDAPDKKEIVGSIIHVTGNERYAWLNNTICEMAGEVRPRKGGEDFEVVYDVAELIWEPQDQPSPATALSARAQRMPR